MCRFDDHEDGAAEDQVGHEQGQQGQPLTETHGGKKCAAELRAAVGCVPFSGRGTSPVDGSVDCDGPPGHHLDPYRFSSPVSESFQTTLRTRPTTQFWRWPGNRWPLRSDAALITMPAGSSYLPCRARISWSLFFVSAPPFSTFSVRPPTASLVRR